jgi:hypothetical protein
MLLGHTGSGASSPAEEHSTVWDGRDTLFEFNFQAFGESPKDCFFAASDDELSPGEYL